MGPNLEIQMQDIRLIGNMNKLIRLTNQDETQDR